MPYSPVYSAPFIQYSAAAPNTSFEVPAGYTAVCRYGVVTQDIGAYDASFYFQDSEAAPYVTFWSKTGIGEFNTEEWKGRVVVPAGGIIYLFFSTLGSAPSGYLGGYLLRNVVS